MGILHTPSVTFIDMLIERATQNQHVPQRTVASASATTTNPGTYSRTKLAILCSHVFVPVSVMRVESRAWHPKQAAQEGRLAEEL
jgi:hypothetical protein